MKTHTLCQLLVMSFVPLTVNAAPIQLSSNTRSEVVESFTTRELWNTAPPNAVGRSNIVVESRLFDSESRPIDGEWHACAIVMIGTADLGVQPVAIRIWTVKPCDLKINAGMASTTDADFSMRMDAREVFNIRVSKDLQVYIGGKAIGRIRE